jgi:integrase
MTVTRWRGKWVVDYYDASGARLRRVSPVQTRRGAEAFEVELRTAEPVSSTSTASSAKEATTVRLADFAPEWLTTYAVVNNKPSEVVGKESTLRVHLLPFFENRRLDEISARDVERYKAEKLDPKREGGPLSPKTVNNHLTILRKLLASAIEWGLLEKLPVIRKLKVPASKFDWLTQEESERFLKAVDQHHSQWRALFWAALRTGLRRGELFALEWDDVDLVAKSITVRRSVYRGKLVPPKNGRTRTVPMTDRLTAVMKEHRAKTMMRGEYVFPGEDGSLTTHQDHVDRPLHGALKRAGLRRITFHSLRHSFASQLVSAGRSLKEVQELLGHESIQVTMRYAHLAPERMREAVSVLDSVERSERVQGER